MLFRAVDISIHYGEVAAVSNASFQVEDREIVTLIGANGAGKTSILMAISGLIGLRNGELWFADHRIDNLKAYRICRLGIIQVPEGRRLFPGLTVEENLQMGAYVSRDKGVVSRTKERIWDFFPLLHERRRQRAKTLSGGQQQMVAIGRALMGAPRLLLLDEPSLGLSPLLVKELAKVVIRVNQEEKISIILVEQNASLALRIGERGYVMELGKIILEGSRDELLQSQIVKEAYLGK